MKTIPIHLANTYNIYIEPDLLSSPFFYEYCRQLKRRLVIIADAALITQYGASLQHRLQQHGLQVDYLSFIAKESHKTRETKQQLEDDLLQLQCGRDTCLLALGGGLVSDLVGFVAATYCRGIPVIYLPTTLLAMVDASIGGKTGVNTSHGKNLIGTFTQPHAVFMDLQTLTTLNRREWVNGFAEIIKHALIADKDWFEQLETILPTLEQQDLSTIAEIITKSCEIKKQIVEQDEHEEGLRQVLNFGHTIGHALEKVAQDHLSHGEAVALGLLLECYVSTKRAGFSTAYLSRVEQLLRHIGFTLTTPALKRPAEILARLSYDKKNRHQQLHCVLLTDIGCVFKPNQYSVAIDPSILHDVLTWAQSLF